MGHPRNDGFCDLVAESRGFPAEIREFAQRPLFDRLHDDGFASISAEHGEVVHLSVDHHTERDSHVNRLLTARRESVTGKIVLVADTEEPARQDRPILAVFPPRSVGPSLCRGYVSIAPVASAFNFEYFEAEGKALLGNSGDLSAQLGEAIVSSIKAIDADAGAPILAWPAIDSDNRWPPLSETIAAMQEMNSALDLRVVHDRHGVSYLGRALSSRDVFSMILPYRAPDDLTTALTEKNETRRRIHLDRNWMYVDPTRIERTVDGHLLIRPCSSGLRAARFSLGQALVTHFGNVDNVYPGWCLLPEADGEEFFEFEWSYWSEGIEATAHLDPSTLFSLARMPGV